MTLQQIWHGLPAHEPARRRPPVPATDRWSIRALLRPTPRPTSPPRGSGNPPFPR